MKRKVFLSVAIALLPLGAVFANKIIIHTSCGTTKTIESSDYSSVFEVIAEALRTEAKDCP